MKKKLTARELRKKVKEIKTGAVQPNKGEVEQIIRGKLVERLKRQKDYRTTFFNRLYKQAEIEEMRNQLMSGKIEVEWSGMKCPENILKASFNLALDDYRNLISSEQYLLKALKNDGLSDEDIKGVINGKFDKTEKAIIKSESKD